MKNVGETATHSLPSSQPRPAGSGLPVAPQPTDGGARRPGCWLKPPSGQQERESIECPHFPGWETEAGEGWRPAGVTSHRGGVAPDDTQRPCFPAQGQDSMTHTSKGAELHLLSIHCLSPGLQISRPPSSPLSAGLGPRTPGLSRGPGGDGTRGQKQLPHPPPSPAPAGCCTLHLHKLRR